MRHEHKADDVRRKFLPAPKPGGSMRPRQSCPTFVPRKEHLPTDSIQCRFCRHADFHLKCPMALNIGICCWPEIQMEEKKSIVRRKTMRKQILSWGLILSLLLTLLPVSAVAADETLPEDRQLAEETAQCTCGAEPDAEGIVTHAEGCPLATQKEPVLETEEPTAGVGEPATETEKPATETEKPVTETEEPATGTEQPTPGTEQPTPGTEQPAQETEALVQETEEPAAEPLTPPTLTCEPLDEENSSDMVLTVEGNWDSYAWESCSYGFWSDWSGDGPNLILSKEDFTAYGFRCTVTRGEQSVTSEAFAYDPSVLERPAMMANGFTDDLLSGSSDYIQFGKRLPNSTFFNIKGRDNGYEIQTTYADAGYRTAISVDGGTKKSVFYNGEPTSVGNSLTAENRLEIVYGGRYVKVTYEVTNHGSTTQEFQIGSSADVMIDNNDHAKVVGVKSSTGKYTGLSMDGSPKNSYQFSLVAPDCNTLWYGYYSKAYINIFNNLSDKDTPYSKDSGMAWSWRGTVAPGQTWSRYVLIGAGELPPAPDAPLINGFPTLKAGEEFTISGTVNMGGNPPDTVHVSIGGKEYEASVNEDGTFAVTDTLPEDTPAGETTLTYWGTTDDGGISEIQSGSITVVAAPYISLTTGSVTVMEGDTGLDEAWLRGFIKSNSDTVNISPSTIDTNTPEKKTVTYKVEKEGFTPATAQLTVTVLPQPAALTQTITSGTGTFALSSTMTYTGGLDYKETGFVYGALQNPTLDLNDGKVTTSPVVNTKGSTLSASVDGSKLAYGVTYYARAYAIASDGTIIYGGQSTGFGMGTPNYGTFSVTGSGNTFTITRTGGTNGEQTVYYRTVNGSAVGGTHFEHKYGTLTFADGSSSSQSVNVTEHSVTSTYSGSAATAYSNADRTYSFEIYRVVGGATIGNGTVERTITKDDNYTVSKDVYEEKSSEITLDDNNKWVADHSGNGDHKIYFQNDRGKNTDQLNFHVTRALDVGTANQQQYLKATSGGFLYRVSFSYSEDEDGYQHVWIANHAPYVYGSPTYNEAIALNDSTFGDAIYTARWETSNDNQSGTLDLPSGTSTGGTNALSPKVAAGKKVGDWLLFNVNDTAQVWFATAGKDYDTWHMTSYSDYLKVYDTTEPQLLGVAPMAGGSYLPGDSVTVALVFDEIVDSANSTNLNQVSIDTNWGTFHYAGGGDTNVLYFTGTVSDTASGTLTVNSITHAEYIKDMAEDTGTDTSGTVSGGDTGADLGTGDNAPAVTVGQITNANGILAAAVSSTSSNVKLEYVWSQSSAAPTTGWQIVVNGSTVSTRQTGGTWYLHARATNSDGVTTYASSSYTFPGSDPVQPPSLTVNADNTNWAKERVITITRSPANAKVTVKTPDDTTAAVPSDTYAATANGTYTFTLESGGETITQMVTVSKLDTTAPSVEIVDLTNTNHTEAVTLTVRVSDGESGVGTVTGTWSSGSTSKTAVFTSQNGVYTTTSPDESGTWTLAVTATDAVGNNGRSTSSAYIISADRPGLTVTKDEEASGDKGIVYHYTVTENGNTGITVALPDGSITTVLTGTFTITEPGDYVIAATDAAGHFVSQDITVEEPESGTLDGVAPDVRLSADSNGAASLPINVSVFEEGSALLNADVALQGGDQQTITLTPDGDGVYTGTFIAAAGGTYTVTATDAANNTGSAYITVHSVTFGGEGHAVPSQLVVSGDYATRPADPVRAGYTFAGWHQNGTAYDFRTAVTADMTLTAKWLEIQATAPTVTESDNLTQPYGTSGSVVSVTATAAGDAAYTLSYQWYRNTTNSTNGGTAITTEATYTIPADLAVGTYYYYCVVTATRNDNRQEATATSGVITVTINKAAQTPPNSGVGYTINYKEETITIEDGYEVFDAQTNGTEIKSGDPITPGATVYICKRGSDTHEPSGRTPINIPSRPDAPIGITKTDETIKGKADGTVSGITAGMEYHPGDGVWKVGTDETMTGLSAGMTVTVRYPASETAFASEQAQVTIEAGTQTLTVTFDENGGTNVEDKTGLSYGVTVTEPVTSRTGYTLDGWYNGETKWDFEADTVTDNITLKARWSLNSYSITYRLDGGTLADGVSNPGVYTVETETFSLSNPTKPGYTFAGWTEGDGTTPQTTVTVCKGTTGNKVYTAHWTMDNFAVKLTADKTNAVYGETITLTAVPNHAADGVTYTYTWYKDGSAAPVSDASGSALTLTNGADSGSYLVKVTASDGSQSQTVSSDAVAVTIRPKEISAAWLGLDQVYGDKAEVRVKISGIVGGDEVSAKVSEAIPDEAGSYALTATLIGNGSSNYTLKNSTATLTIQPKPVIFTVAGNTVQADGNVKTAHVTADDKTCTYTVTYQQNGEQVDAPKEAGSYEIWVELNNSNYRHTNGSSEMQVGTLTITQAPPVMYTASFAGGESVEGTAPTAQIAVANSQITLPANSFAREDYLFTGWTADGDTRLYQPGDRFTMPARNVTFTAQWQAVFTVGGTVTEKTDSEDTKAENAVVSLWLGANKISEVTTGEDGKFQFENLIPGIYNLVVTKDARTVTSKVEITTADKQCDAVLPKGATNSVVKVTPGSPDIVVGNLDTVFHKTDETVYTEADQTTVDKGGKVEITFTAEEKQETEVSEDLQIIQAVSGDRNLALVMDCKLEKEVFDATGKKIDGASKTITQSNVLLEILLPLPAQLQGKADYAVYRAHDNVAEEMNVNPGSNEEGFKVEGSYITIYAQKFSTYVIGYTEFSGNSHNNNQTGSGGGGSSTPAYSPSIVQPEHGAVTVSPKKPQRGDKVTITATPEKGFTVEEVIVTGPDGKPIAVTPNDDGTYAFTQPSGNVTIAVTFRQLTSVSDCPRDESCPLAPFADADRNAWYHDGVHYCVEKGLMLGTSKTAFSPNTTITRGMIVTILWRLEGSPIVSHLMDYSDVKPEDWCGEAVRWATSTGVATGYGNGTFGPNDPITREQMAAMLWRYAGSPRADGSLLSFADRAQTSDWAQPAMIWAVKQGLIAGVSHDWLNPRGKATRAQAATILMRFAENMAQ